VEINIVNEIAALQRLSIGQLRQRFAEAFGEATNASNRTWLLKRISWRMQALAEGDLSERARRRAEELARDADLRLNPPQPKVTTTTPLPEPVRVPAPIDPRLPPPGTILIRPYKANWCRCKCSPTASPTPAASIPRSAPSPKPSLAATPTASSSSATASTTTRRTHDQESNHG